MNFKEVALKAAVASGKVLSIEFKKSMQIEGKGLHDLVSGADYESEKRAIEVIKSAFKDHNIFAEESGAHNRNSEFSWYIDPLDGTSNFITGNPYFSVSIALAQNGEVILGVVYNPILEELNFAEKGQGAYLNDIRLKVSDKSDIKSAIIATAYAAEGSKIKEGLRTVEKLALTARKVIINFSPALDLCNIARGKIDALVDNGTTPEDHAAGSLIVSEAGGIIKNYGYDNFDVTRTGIIAGSETIMHEIDKLL